MKTQQQRGIGCGVLIIVQSASVPFDRRVWLEAQALTTAGYRVCIICPKGPRDPGREVLDGVRMYRYEPPPAASSVPGYVLKSAYCWLRSALLTLVVVTRERISVIQACSPPDTYWALVVFYRISGKRFVYDQRDLNPELFRARFGPPRRVSQKVLHRVLLWLERRTYRTADHVIVASDAFRPVALARGGVAPAQLTVVRTGPDTTRMQRRDGRPELRGGRRYLLAYQGSLGSPDGLDLVLRALDVLVHRFGRDDVHLALLGFGDAYEDLVVLCHGLELDDYVTFTGRVGSERIAEFLSTADIGICPDPRNDVATMSTAMQYLSFALPVVAYDLAGTRVAGGAAVEYIEPAPAAGQSAVTRFAEVVDRLLDDPARRAEMAAEGRRRADTVLDWGPQGAAYVGVYDRLSGRAAVRPSEAPPIQSGSFETAGEG